MTLTTAVPSPGWFPDPGDPAQERWWSGETWTEHHRAAVDAPPAPAADGDASPLETAQPDYVFDMSAQQTPEAPAEIIATPAPERPTLPTFQELLAAAAAPAPDTFDAAPVPHPELALPAYEPLDQGSNGAPMPQAATEEVARAAHRQEPAPDAVAGVAPVPDVAHPVGSAVEFAPASPAPALLTTPVFEPAPAEAAPVRPPVPPVPAAHAAAAATPAAPEFAAQQAPTPLPAFTTQPDTSAPVTPQPPAVPAMPGFAVPSQPSMPNLVMPSAPILEPMTSRSEQPARHAEAVEVLPPVPAAPAAPAPVGYTASADVAVANRYRAALHAPEPGLADDQNPFAAALGPFPTGGGVPASAVTPSQTGWQGMPLPGPSAAFSPNVPVPGAYVASPTTEGHNKTAWTALGSGALAIGLAVFFLFFDRIGLWPALLGIAAVVQGIVGAVHSRKTGSGLGPALGAIGLGLVALGIIVTTAISWTLFPEYVIEGQTLEQDIVAYGAETGIDVVSADCPDEMSGSTGAELSCTAFDSAGTAYPVDVTVDQDGYFSWSIDTANA